MSSIAFVLCIERGELERKALLLVRSIRRFAGRYANATVLTFQPRPGTEVTSETRRVLRELDARHITEPLNTEFTHYPIANKIFAAARAEEIASEDVIVFLDSDTVIVNEPGALALREGIDAAARPVDIHRGANEPPHDHPTHWLTRHRRVSSMGEGDPFDGYWLRMYELLRVDAPGDKGWAGSPHHTTPFVETTCSRERIRAYCNSGLVAFRRSAGLARQWREDFLALVRANHIPGEMHYLDQLSLAATLTRVWDRVDLLDGRYNYPLPGREALREPFRSMPLEELVHIHYHAEYDRAAALAEGVCI